MQYRRGKLGRDPAELNITAFMNLMVILVPFLLITAVFSRITILELNLPEAATAQLKSSKTLRLEVIVHPEALEVSDANTGRIKMVRNKSGKHNYQRLSDVLKQIKEKFPDKKDITILARSSTSYNTLVQVMDAVRLFEVVSAGSTTRYELFPEISIGDAPRSKRANKRQGK